MDGNGRHNKEDHRCMAKASGITAKKVNVIMQTRI